MDSYAESPVFASPAEFEADPGHGRQLRRDVFAAVAGPDAAGAGTRDIRYEEDAEEYGRDWEPAEESHPLWTGEGVRDEAALPQGRGDADRAAQSLAELTELWDIANSLHAHIRCVAKRALARQTRAPVTPFPQVFEGLADQGSSEYAPTEYGESLAEPPLESFGPGDLTQFIPLVPEVQEWMRKVRAFKAAAAAVALEEEAAWQQRPESEPSLLPRLVAYGRAGRAAHPAAWATGAAANQTAWSAGFISFVMEQALIRAGIPGDPFGRSTLHSNYIAAAKANRTNGAVANPFWLFTIGEVKPEVGDFLCKNRPGSNAVTFANVHPGQSTHVDVVTHMVSAAQLQAAGGNRLGNGGTVAQRPVRLTNGFVTAASAGLNAGPYFAILRARTNPLEGVVSFANFGVGLRRTGPADGQVSSC